MSIEDDITGLQLRIDELETRLAFQEDTLQALSEQLAHQQSVTEQQQQMLQALYAQIRDVQDASSADGAASSAQERPPHY
jgi:SlyX protein